MLERLQVRDLILVEHAVLELGAGLVVVTGETGAGKSLLVQAASLLVGERADHELVREGARSAVVEGTFRLAGEPARRVAALLAEWNVEFDGETLIVQREVMAEGRSRATVNQSSVTLAALKRLGAAIVDLHGQHEHQSLLAADAGLETLDRLGRHDDEVGRWLEALTTWREARAELERLDESMRTFADRRAWMAEALAELDEAKLVAGEEEELARESSRLAHADRLRELVGTALESLAEGDAAALDAIGRAAHALETAAGLDRGLDGLVTQLDEARIAASETARALADYAGTLGGDPRALEEVEARRERIARLVRRYRRPATELIAWHDELQTELASGEDAEGTLARARERVEHAAADCDRAGRALSRRRHAAAAEWGTKITRELKPLGLPHARLGFAVETAAELDQATASGLDRVAIQFTANPGEPPRPLQKIASGGELSRVMLALKTALEAQDQVDVLVFDEVDSGIGGAVAQAVGERLRKLARHRQVVCVTHLPMIAALATHHVRVTKHVASGRTTVRVEPLAPDARVEEIARMLAGDRVSATTRRQARELLETAPPGAR